MWQRNTQHRLLEIALMNLKNKIDKCHYLQVLFCKHCLSNKLRKS